MKIIMHIPHYGWIFSLATSMPEDNFYIVNKVEPDEQRGSDLCVEAGYWQWLRELKPKPGNVKLLGTDWSGIDQDDYDVAILIPDANQIRLMNKYLTDFPIVWKFHLNNSASRNAIKDLQAKGKDPLRGYPCIFSAESQKIFYDLKGEVAWGQSPDIYKDWKGEVPRAMWTAERIGLPKQTDVRYMSRGGNIWDQVKSQVLGKRYGLDFRLGTPITPFEDLLFAYKINRCYIECATETILTDGLVEAMMTGMPPIVYAAWEMDKIIEDGVNGFKSKDPKELASFCQMLIDDYDLAKEIGKNARKTALKYWSPNVVKTVYHKCFEIAIRSNFTKIPRTQKTKKEMTRGDKYLLKISDDRLRELEYNYYKRHTGLLECPYCFERFRIVHLKGKHALEHLNTPREETERRIKIVKYKWEKPQLEARTLKNDNIIKLNRTCPHCQFTEIERIGKTVICRRCKRILGKWEDFQKYAL